MAGVCCFRIPAVTEVGAGTRSMTGPATVIPAGRGRDVTPTSMSALTSPVWTEEPVRTVLANTPVTACPATTGTTVSWMLTSATGMDWSLHFSPLNLFNTLSTDFVRNDERRGKISYLPQFPLSERSDLHQPGEQLRVWLCGRLHWQELWDQQKRLRGKLPIITYNLEAKY